jgi:hypothetical protein
VRRGGFAEKHLSCVRARIIGTHMERTLIQQYATGIVKGLIEQARSLGDLDHGPTKGRLRELFVTNVLKRYLTSQFGVGSGIVVNQKGEQSREMDIIIYDNRILPPFIREERLGVFPIESVVATIEVKSRMTKSSLLDANESAKQLRKEIASPRASIYTDEHLQPPGLSFVAFKGHDVGDLKDENSGSDWLKANITDMTMICLVGGFSWIKVERWRLKESNEFAEETKRYIGVLLDNIRTQSERTYSLLWSSSKKHRDWIGVYTRDNDEVKRFFDSQDPKRYPSSSGQ